MGTMTVTGRRADGGLLPGGTDRRSKAGPPGAPPAPGCFGEATVTASMRTDAIAKGLPQSLSRAPSSRGVHRLAATARTRADRRGAGQAGGRRHTARPCVTVRGPDRREAGRGRSPRMAVGRSWGSVATDGAFATATAVEATKTVLVRLAAISARLRHGTGRRSPAHARHERIVPGARPGFKVHRTSFQRSATGLLPSTHLTRDSGAVPRKVTSRTVV